MIEVFNELALLFNGGTVLSDEDKANFRLKFNSLANSMLEIGIPEEELDDFFKLKHYFSENTYTREITIPKGVLGMGRIHKYPTINIVSKGKINILSEEGFKTIEAPYTFVSGPGVQKLGFALEDTVWTNVFATDDKDPVKILNDMTIDPKTYLEFYQKQSIEGE